MDIHIDWQSPVQLTRHRKPLVDEKSLPDRISSEPAIYFFSRRFGSKFEPFYIDETANLRARLKAHLRSKAIAFVLLDLDPKSAVKGGVRYFHYGYVRTKPGQDVKTCLRIAQRYLIRDAVSQGMALVNKNLTTIKTHSLTFGGSKQARAIYDKRAKVEI